MNSTMLIFIILSVLSVVVIVYYISKNKETNEFSDEQLLNFAKSDFDKSKMMGKDEIIGYHNGIPVKVSYLCSDLCPDYTVKIVRYDVDLDKCDIVGGIKKTIYIPSSITVKPQTFCFPKVIVVNNIYNFIDNNKIE